MSARKRQKQLARYKLLKEKLCQAKLEYYGREPKDLDLFLWIFNQPLLWERLRSFLCSCEIRSLCDAFPRLARPNGLYYRSMSHYCLTRPNGLNCRSMSHYCLYNSNLQRVRLDRPIYDPWHEHKLLLLEDCTVIWCPTEKKSNFESLIGTLPVWISLFEELLDRSPIKKAFDNWHSCTNRWNLLENSP